MNKILNIVVPMAGQGKSFVNAGYSFPKPLIDVNSKTMIEVVVNNLKPNCDHRFIFICKKEDYEKYDLYHILQNITSNKFEVVVLSGQTEGAACTALAAIRYIDNNSELLIANSDQFIELDINKFIAIAREGEKDGLIMTFPSSHPKWSYARVDKEGRVLEVAEKKVISRQATAGLYYFKKGQDFINSAQSMVRKNIRYNNEFYVSPVYNEMILEDKQVFSSEINGELMHGLGTPEDLAKFVVLLKDKQIKI